MAHAARSYRSVTPVQPSIADAAMLAAARPRDEDDLLLQAIADDDRGAFARLVSRHADRGYALALRILKNPSDADDVVQDSFMKLWMHRKRMEIGRAKFSTWLYRVITTMHRASMASLLEAALARLPDQQRVAVILSYHEAMSNAEIAEVMDTTVMAVESLLKRGRQQLRKVLAHSEADIRQSFTQK